MSHMAGPLDQRSSASAVPLVFRAAPVPGQSIAEVILEAAADNSYRTAGHVISAAGIDYRGDPSIFARARGREEDLAITLRMPGQVDLLRSISPNPIAGRPGWSDFFGVPLRNVHRDMRRRRVSPRADAIASFEGDLVCESSFLRPADEGVAAGTMPGMRSTAYLSPYIWRPIL